MYVFMYVYVCMCTHVLFSLFRIVRLFLSTQGRSLDSGANWSKELVRIDYFSFILINVHFELQVPSDWNETVQQSSDNTGKVCVALTTCCIITCDALPRLLHMK